MSECGCQHADSLERTSLVALLAINAIMFGIEFSTGWFADSAGLIADSLDMFADATVYGIALYAVGRSISAKRTAASLSGAFQLILGIGVLCETGRRFIQGSEPVSALMMTVGVLALAANVACLFILAKHRKGEVHMRASWIFSTNDVIANLGVILSGLLVTLTSSRLPDLIIGAVIAALVVHGGFRILRDATSEKERCSGA